MTPEFLQDVAAVTMEQAFRYSLTVGSTEEFHDVLSNNNATFTSQTINGNNRTRGLGQSTPTHDFFLTNIPIDVYNSERFTLVSGPNAILFGSGNPSGNNDSSLKRARVGKPSYSLESRFDSNDSMRTSLDLNQPIIKNKLALRLNGLKSDERAARKPNFDRQERVFATVEVKPFKWISARAYMEDVHRDRMPVRNTMVTDGVTPWINAGRRMYDNGLGKALPVATSNPLAVGFDPAFSIYNTLTTPILLMGNIAGSSPAGFQYVNTTVQTRSYDSAARSAPVRMPHDRGFFNDLDHVADPLPLADPARQAGVPLDIVADIQRSPARPGWLAYTQITPLRTRTRTRTRAAKFAPLQQAGLVLVIGTAGGTPMKSPDRSTWRELGIWVKRLGVDPMTALRAATCWPAVAMKVEQAVGTIHEGKFADIPP